MVVQQNTLRAAMSCASKPKLENSYAFRVNFVHYMGCTTVLLHQSGRTTTAAGDQNQPSSNEGRDDGGKTLVKRSHKKVEFEHNFVHTVTLGWCKIFSSHFFYKKKTLDKSAACTTRLFWIAYKKSKAIQISNVTFKTLKYTSEQWNLLFWTF